jgi:hypothetical protein
MQEKMRKVRWGLEVFFKYLAGARFITCAFNLKKLQHTLGSVRYRTGNRELSEEK